jgi:glycosyltransferase involved in cell wall biosynthesis
VIGLVTTSYPRWPGDSAGNFVAGHVTALRALGHDVDVVAARSSHGLFYTGGAPDAIEAAPLRKLAAGAWFTACHTARIARRARTRNWTHMIAHWLAPSALSSLAASWRLPMLAIAHGGDIHLLDRLGALPATLRLLAARRARLAFVSAELHAIALRSVARSPELERYVQRAIVQAMGIDHARFATLRRTLGAVPTLVVAARLVPLKGIDVALDALAHLAPDVHLVIAGDGPLRDALATHASRVPSRHRVSLLGTVDDVRRDELLACAHAVLIPSRSVGGRSEGTPLIAIEALAAGVPVIASRVGGLPELAQRCSIALVPPDEPRALAHAIERVLADPPPAASLQASVLPFDWCQVAANLSPNGEPSSAVRNELRSCGWREDTN